jgi:hypothetical protein
VDVYNRHNEDSNEGTHVTVEDSHVNNSPSMIGNPSLRRDGVRMLLWCENCDATTALDIVQHKGETIISTHHFADTSLRCDYYERDPAYLDYLETEAERHFAEEVN